MVRQQGKSKKLSADSKSSGSSSERNFEVTDPKVFPDPLPKSEPPQDVAASDSDLKMKIVYEYRKIMKKRSFLDTDEDPDVTLKFAWNDNLASMTKELEIGTKQREAARAKGKWTYCDPLTAGVNIAKKKATLKTPIKENKQTAPIILIDHVQPIPPSFMWTPIKKNVAVDDEKIMLNIPYFGEEVIEKDKCFIDNLLVTYDGFLGDYEIMDNAVLIDLINAVNEQIEREKTLKNLTSEERAIFDKMKTENADCDDESASQNSARMTTSQIMKFPSNELIRQIAKVFPQLGDFTQLKKKIVDICKNQPGFEIPLEFFPNIDGANAESLPREKTINAFHKYFCRRCFVYGCFLHPSKEDRPDPKLKIRVTEAPDPCGSKCYLAYLQESSNTQPLPNPMELEDDASSLTGSKYGWTARKSSLDTSSSSLNSVDSNSSNDSLMYMNKAQAKAHRAAYAAKNRPRTEWPIDSETDTSEKISSNENSFVSCSENDSFQLDEKWTGADESLFRVLHVVYPSNYCTISQILQTKTCEQVYRFAQNEKVESSLLVGSDQLSPRKQQNKSRTWSIYCQKNNIMNNSSRRGHYIPCNHDGECDNDCHCIQAKVSCEKFCQCSSKCENKFPGCECKGQCKTKQCSCYIDNRECDPDLCKVCGAGLPDLDNIRCRNISIQRGINKSGEHLLVAKSEISGWGVYSKRSIQKDEFISEYCGEVITQDEADRRGIVYDKNKSSFLFNLNNEYVIDATRKGNIARFINHSINPNCRASVRLVNGDHRIGIFSKRAIEAGEELFFDYGYESNKLTFVGIEKSDAPQSSV